MVEGNMGKYESLQFILIWKKVLVQMHVHPWSMIALEQLPDPLLSFSLLRDEQKESLGELVNGR
jgi:hypothetical protein